MFRKSSSIQSCGQKEITLNESYINWWVLPGGLSAEEAQLMVATFASHSPAGTPCFVLAECPQAPWSPTGRWCWSSPFVRQSRTRTLVTQRHFLDV